ncbi:unnamed protein product [Orchesella dallaii]|uniref:BZIP domain-containing protein n=1 Tax=Orchesella dallaii TaxID=48710 RepID=A0ABP1QB88_9HEXA
MMEYQAIEMDFSSWNPFSEGSYEVPIPLIQVPIVPNQYQYAQVDYELDSDLFAGTNLVDDVWEIFDDYGLDFIFQDLDEPIDVPISTNYNYDPHHFMNAQNEDASNVWHQSVTNEPTQAFTNSNLQAPQLAGETTQATCAVATTKDTRKRKVYLYDRDINDPNLTKEEIKLIKKAKRSKKFHEMRKTRLFAARERFKTGLKSRELELQDLLDTMAIIQKQIGEVDPEIMKEVNVIKQRLQDLKEVRKRFKLK